MAHQNANEHLRQSGDHQSRGINYKSARDIGIFFPSHDVGVTLFFHAPQTLNIQMCARRYKQYPIPGHDARAAKVARIMHARGCNNWTSEFFTPRRFFGRLESKALFTVPRD